ncbi:MAG: symmetrical bis(5'-nucleosyl)-tetraphosphatase [Gammaproteobacteria bacterium]
MATYAVGDIHGCLDLLRRLLDDAGFDGARDRLWLVGDVINRGGQSLATLRWLYKNRAMITLVLGNHDLHLLAAHAGAVKPRADDTIGDILRAEDGDDLCAWLRTMPLAYREGDYLMVHAGVLPMWDGDEVVRLAAEASAVIGGEEWHDFAKVLYGDTPDNWSPTLEGFDRWRVIVNALTRLRVCDDDGGMLLKFSGAPKDAPPDSRPWFDIAGRKTAKMVIICGHWAALGFVHRRNLLALDTGAAWGGGLTAVRLEDEAVFYRHAR